MRVRRSALVVSIVVTAAATTTLPSSSIASDGRSGAPVTVAVIGDVPYGEVQEADFGVLIDAVNRDPKVRTVVHVGDIKSGSTACTDERILRVRDAFASFRDPVVYTPGDNEWTDCHRPAAGGFDPLERLAFVRSSFFAAPGVTLGRRTEVVDAQEGLPENVRWISSRVGFATLHVVGSDNGLAPWTGNAAPTAAQQGEVDARVAATVAWIDETFDMAERHGLAGVVLAMQADTFPTPSVGQQAIVDRLAARAAAFDGEVLVLQGDSHRFLVDQPLPLDNLTRIVVHGETLPFEYLRLTIDARAPELFTWERIQVTT